MSKIILLSVLGGLLSMNAIGSNKKIWKGRAVLVIKDSKIEVFKKAVKKIIKPTLNESGCISYEAFQVYDESGNETNKFEFHELWKSKDAMMIDHKEKSAHMIEFFKEIKINSDESYVINFEVDGKWVKQF